MSEEEDERLSSLMVMLRHTEREGHLTDERYLMLHTIIEWMRVTAPTPVPLSTPDIAH